MRQEPTKAEQRAAGALADAFRREGHTVRFPSREIKDRPDVLIEIEGTLIACECTQIPPSRIYYWHKREPQDDDWNGCDLASRVWPNEPHIWLADAVSDKARQVPEYLSRTSAQEAWLLVHSPPTSNQFFVQQDREWVLHALRHGANMKEHPFSQIHLWTPQGGIEPLFARASGDPSQTKFEVDFKSGYPTCTVVQGSFGFTTVGSSTSSLREFHYTHTTRNARVIEPEDPSFLPHDPAIRNANYDIHLRAWSDRAVMQWNVTFEDEQETIELAPETATGLSPDTNYWIHYIHEYAAPKRLRTHHTV